MPFRLWQPLLAWPILLFHRPVWATPAIAPPTTAPPLNTSPQPIVETPLKPVQCQVGATTSAITWSPGALQTTSPNGVSQPCPPTFTLHRAISPLPLPIAGDEIESLPIRQITSPGSSKTTLVNFLTPYQVATPSALTEIQRVPVPTNVYAQTPSPSPSAPPDPELGTLQLQPLPPPLPPREPANKPLAPIGQIPCPELDPELGCLLIEPVTPLPFPNEPPRPPARSAVVYLLPRIEYFRSSNVLSAIDPVDDGLFRPGITLFAAPPLGPNTFFVAAATGNLARYDEQKQVNYNELLFRAGIYQRLSPTMFGEIGWANQQLFIGSDDLIGFPRGTKFLDEHAIRLELSRRDALTPRLILNSFYQLRVSFSNPAERSRLINSLNLSLLYDIQPNLQAGLDYQFSFAHYTRASREDEYHQIGVRLIYTAFRNVQFSLLTGYSFGRSTDPTVDFNGLVFGISIGATLGLF